MDPIKSPYTPGAGSPPPELAGRGAVRETAAIALQRQVLGHHSQSIIMVGLRGVGKTVLLDQIQQDAEAAGIAALSIESLEQRPLPTLLAPPLRQTLLQLSKREAAQALALRALRVLMSLAKTFRVAMHDVEISVDLQPERGQADSGDLDADLQDLFSAVGAAAQASGTCVALFVDELQYVEEDQLAALILALHQASLRRLPITMIGAGLPQVRARAGRAKSYAERLFEFVEIGALPDSDAREALQKPATAAAVRFERAALDEIVKQTRGYPYFLQAWGKHVWVAADGSPITEAHVRQASAEAIEALDRSFFRVRFDRLTPAERRYMRAMSELGPGPHRSGEIAAMMGKQVSAVAPFRAQLIGKGMIWSPGYGDTAFTVPLFDEFMKRTMPDME